MADSPYIFEIDQSNYEQIVIQGSHQVPVLVDFWATWCQPCQTLMPLLAKLADEYQGRFILAKINTEEQQEIAAQFGIRSIPTVKLFSQGQPVDEFAGALPETDIRAFLDRHLPRESDNAVQQAQELLSTGDISGAITALQAAQAADPGNPRITMTLAQVLASSGEIEAAEQTLDSLPDDEQSKPEIARLRGQMYFHRLAGDASIDQLMQQLADNPDDLETRFRLAAAQVMQGDASGALDNFLLVMQKDRKFGDDGARLALLKLFDMLGDEPAVARYRARMFALLH